MIVQLDYTNGFWQFLFVPAGSDTGGGDTGGGDTGGGDTGSGDTGVVFSGAFGGGASVDGNTYTQASGGDSWAGFANEDTSIYPFSFPNGGTITFTGDSAAAVDLYFKFENAPYPDVDPNFATASVTVNGSGSYSVDIPAQDAANTYSSFLLYVTTLDQAVTLTDVTVTAN